MCGVLTLNRSFLPINNVIIGRTQASVWPCADSSSWRDVHLLWSQTACCCETDENNENKSSPAIEPRKKANEMPAYRVRMTQQKTTQRRNFTEEYFCVCTSGIYKKQKKEKKQTDALLEWGAQATNNTHRRKTQRDKKHMHSLSGGCLLSRAPRRLWESEPWCITMVNAKKEGKRRSR